MHKFGTKPVRSKNFPINPVEWLPKKEVTHIPLKQPGSQVWEIFAQRAITINPKETETIELGLGVRMRRGSCQVSLRQEIQASGCVIQEGELFSRNVADIVITILNNSDSVVSILEGDPLGFVDHSVRIRTIVVKEPVVADESSH